MREARLVPDLGQGQADDALPGSGSAGAQGAEAPAGLRQGLAGNRGKNRLNGGRQERVRRAVDGRRVAGESVVLYFHGSWAE